MDVFDILVSNGIDINHQDKCGLTILMVVCVCYPHIDMIQKILDSGAKIDIKSSTRNTALHFLSKNEIGHMILDRLCCYGRLEFINSINNNGSTPLMMDASKHNFKLVEKLISCGADCNLINNETKTALMCASKFSYDIDHENIDIVLLRYRRASLPNPHFFVPILRFFLFL